MTPRPFGEAVRQLGSRRGKRHDALAVDQDLCGLRAGRADDGPPGDQSAHERLLSASWSPLCYPHPVLCGRARG